jgi:hypothetical protein
MHARFLSDAGHPRYRSSRPARARYGGDGGVLLPGARNHRGASPARSRPAAPAGGLIADRSRVDRRPARPPRRRGAGAISSESSSSRAIVSQSSSPTIRAANPVLINREKSARSTSPADLIAAIRRAASAGTMAFSRAATMFGRNSVTSVRLRCAWSGPSSVTGLAEHVAVLADELAAQEGPSRARRARFPRKACTLRPPPTKNPGTLSSPGFRCMAWR